MNKRLLHILFALFAASSCIYDYDADFNDAPDRVVIEGDISLGENCSFLARPVMVLTDNPRQLQDKLLPEATFTVEDEFGNSYTAKQQSRKEATIDLTSAPTGRKYRLLVETVSGEKTSKYATPWMDPVPAPSIGNMTETVSGPDLHLGMDLSLDNGSGCYRWDYEILNRYHALFTTPMWECKVVNATTVTLIDHFHQPEQNTWWGYTYCWRLAYSQRTSVAIAKALEGGRLKEHEFLSIPLRSKELAMGECYVKLKAKSIPEEEYRYLDAMNKSSEIEGSLLAPLPSDIMGNIRNVDDPLDFALGYVSVNTVAKKIFHIKTPGSDSWCDPSAYFKDPFKIYTSIQSAGEVWQAAYSAGLYPYRMIGFTLMWVPQNCVDCRLAGGTVEKPDGWEMQIEP